MNPTPRTESDPLEDNTPRVPRRDLIVLLKELAQALRDIPAANRKNFNLGVWAKERVPEEQDLSCGTTCCAYGLATTLPSWKAAGYALSPGGIRNASLYPKLPRVGEGERPKFTSFDDLAISLGLSLDDCVHIFLLDGYASDKMPSPLDVAGHIDEVVEKLSTAS